MVIKRLVFELKNSVGRPGSAPAYRQLLENQALHGERLRALQLEKLRKLFAHAKKNSSFYGRHYSDIDARDISSLADWQKLPFVTKRDIREYRNDIAIGHCSRHLRKITTGGSTGEPLTVFHDVRFPAETLGWRLFSWWGIEPSCNKAFVYRKIRTGWRAALNGLLWYPTKRVFLDASFMSADAMAGFAQQLIKCRPEILGGYVGGIQQFAMYCDARGIKLPPIRAVWVTSSPLTESQRQFIERVFGCPVYDQYGCSEIFWLAAECKKREGLHAFADCRYIEIIGVDDNPVPNGTWGEVVVTDLENFGFPLIRYRNEDRGRYLDRPCSCGIQLPLLDKIKGRQSECFRTPSGDVIAGEYLTTIFDDKPDAVRAFQLHQKEDYSVTLRCVLGSSADSRAICETKREWLLGMMRQSVDVMLEYVEEIPHEGGKTRYIVSECR